VMQGRPSLAAHVGKRVVIGIRPEDLEDPEYVANPTADARLPVTVDVREAMGAEVYAHFTVDSERVASRELEELLEDTDPGDVAPAAEGVQIVARLAAGSGVRQGQEAELWVDTSQLHLFDPDTGLSLLSSARASEESPQLST